MGDPVHRLARPVDFCARSIKERRASLTASSVGNTLATSENLGDVVDFDELMWYCRRKLGGM